MLSAELSIQLGYHPSFPKMDLTLIHPKITCLPKICKSSLYHLYWRFTANQVSTIPKQKVDIETAQSIH